MWHMRQRPLRALSGQRLAVVDRLGQGASAAPALWPFALLSATYFGHIGFFNPYLPLWLHDMGLGLTAIGVLTSVQAFTRVFAPYAWGWLSDHTGERVRLLRWGAGVALLAACWLHGQTGPWAIGALLLLMFTHTSAMLPMSEAALLQAVDEGGPVGARRFDAQRYGRVRLWGSLGFLLTVLLAGAWFEKRGLQDFPAWTALSLLLVWACTWALPNVRQVRPQGATHAGAVSRVLALPSVRWFFVSVFCHVWAHVGVYVFFSLYADQLGYSKLWIGVLWAVSVVAEIMWFFGSGTWLSRMSLPRWLVLCALAMALRMGLTAQWADVLWLLLAVQCLHALTFAMHHTVCVAVLSQHFSGPLRVRGQGLYAAFGYGLPGVLAAWAGTWLSHTWGFAAVFWSSALASVLAALASWQMARCSDQPHTQTQPHTQA